MKHPVLQYYTFLTEVVKCSTGVPLKRECEVLEYLAVLSPQYISVSVVLGGDLVYYEPMKSP